MDQDRLTETAEHLSRSLTDQDLDQTLHAITATAVEALPGVDYASITVRQEDGRLRSVAATDPLVERLDAAQVDLEEGPCHAAATGEEHVFASDLRADPRFPTYGPLAAEAGVLAQAGVRIFQAGSASAVLNLYARTTGTFTDYDDLAALLAERSSRAVGRARDLEAVRASLAAHQLVGRAVGIAMERYGLPEHRAFAFLARLAQHHQVELPAAAQAVVVASEHRAD